MLDVLLWDISRLEKLAFDKKKISAKNLQPASGYKKLMHNSLSPWDR